MKVELSKDELYQAIMNYARERKPSKRLAKYDANGKTMWTMRIRNYVEFADPESRTGLAVSAEGVVVEAYESIEEEEADK